MKRLLVLVLVLAVSGSVLGGLFAASGTTAIDITVSGVASDNGAVVPWIATATVAGSDASTPRWDPIEGAIGVIDQDHADDDGDGGGLASIWVPAAPDETWRITVYLTNANELQEAYESLLLYVKVVAAPSATATSHERALNEVAANFTGATPVTDIDGSGSKTNTLADTLILTPQNGSVTFYVSNGDGTLMDTQTAALDATSTIAGEDTNDATQANVFIVGIHGGTFTVSEGGDANNLDPDFFIEVEQS